MAYRPSPPPIFSIPAIMHARTSVKKQEERIAALQAQIEQLEKRFGPGEDPNKLVNDHIKLLHRYNEAKDATQIIIGKLASFKQTTIRQIHEDYDLRDDD
ncbi:hypothetical protein FA95DRAFT_1675071 [Auriscalpium vulgare]|uniref:Uncharacterized protein n=1 Tax=Auriscalpium vulgare TaxID=40419 RepID=A0ACB8S973_9AGAM|nr:hypothetical protein FA95DRAFT_1675071 [Auriscalpium vulgare]